MVAISKCYNGCKKKDAQWPTTFAMRQLGEGNWQCYNGYEGKVVGGARAQFALGQLRVATWEYYNGYENKVAHTTRALAPLQLRGATWQYYNGSEPTIAHGTPKPDGKLSGTLRYRGMMNYYNGS